MPMPTLKSILIADDHEAIRRELRRMLETFSELLIFEAENGVEAITKATQVMPDLIVLDLSMPEMGGLEAAAAIHHMLPLVPLILLTAHYSREVELAARQCGVCAVFSKYENPDGLLCRIRKEIGLPVEKDGKVESNVRVANS